jgi:hypothetical protein
LKNVKWVSEKQEIDNYQSTISHCLYHRLPFRLTPSIPLSSQEKGYGVRRTQATHVVENASAFSQLIPHPLLFGKRRGVFSRVKRNMPAPLSSQERGYGVCWTQAPEFFNNRSNVNSLY